MALGISNLQNLAASVNANKNLNVSVEKNSTTQSTNSTSSKQEFESLEEYTKYLGEKYGVNSGVRMMSGVPTTMVVSAVAIQKAFENPEARQNLEQKLAARNNIDVLLQTTAALNPSAEVTHAGWVIDDNGEVMMFSGAKTKDSWANQGSLNSYSSNLDEELEKILEKARLKQEEFKKDLEKAAQKASQKQEELKSDSKQNLDFNNEQNLKLTQNFSFEVQGKNFDELLQNFKNALSNTSMLDLKA
ncbi:MAG: hypothetical protein J1E31_04445 [Helicobacter sp.]|nr:hypothetical protein [Helicobacter sp.]